jgi:aspartyl aminopeptidase
MADMVSIGSKSDTGAGSKLKTGSMRRSYSFKKKKRKKRKGFRVANNNYIEGR